jgi:hypothetical protein
MEKVVVACSVLVILLMEALCVAKAAIAVGICPVVLA